MKTPSVEPVLRSRLLPRISFRFMLVMMTLVAVIAAVGRLAGQGDALASGLLMGVGFLMACFGMFILLFLVTWTISSLWYRKESDLQHGSPFAEGQLPPQIIPPREHRS